jgi:CBS domain-containing protein
MTTTATETVERLLGTVEEVATGAVVSLSPEESIGAAARSLERHRVSGAPVVEGSRLVGVVSLKDLFEAANVPSAVAATSGPWHRYERLLDATQLTVGDVMTHPVTALPVGTSIVEAARIMRLRDVNRIPIVDRSGSVVAVLARDDVLEAVVRAGEA